MPYIGNFLDSPSHGRNPSLICSDPKYLKTAAAIQVHGQRTARQKVVPLRADTRVLERSLGFCFSFSVPGSLRERVRSSWWIQCHEGSLVAWQEASDSRDQAVLIFLWHGLESNICICFPALKIWAEEGRGESPFRILRPKEDCPGAAGDRGVSRKSVWTLHFF